MWPVDHCGWRCLCGDVAGDDKLGKKSGGQIKKDPKGLSE